MSINFALDPVVKIAGTKLTIADNPARINYLRLIEGVSMAPELVTSTYIRDPNDSEVELTTQLTDILDVQLTVDWTHPGVSEDIPVFSGTATRVGTITTSGGEVRESFNTEIESFKQLQTHGYYNHSEHAIDSTPDYLWKDHTGGPALLIGGGHGLLEQMKRNRRCRIFTESSLSDIIAEVTGEYSLTVDGEAAPTTVLPFVVQYMESDYNFLMRLLQEAGMVYFALEEGTLTLALNNGSGTDRTQDIVLSNLDPYAFVKARDLSLTSTFAGFDPSTQTLETGDAVTSGLEGTIGSAGSVIGEIHDLVPEVVANGRYTATSLADLAVRDPGITDAFAGLGLIKFRSLNQVLRPGEKLALPYAGDVHVQTVEHFWNPDKGYSAIVTAVAAGLPYHTVQKPHIPRIYGPQTAIVDDNIDPDTRADCRIKVMFNWPDIGGRDPLSAYVRVVQPWAGEEHGAQFVPHPGDEVVVEFMNGDPNFPLITGSVYNGVNGEFYTPEIPTEPTTTIRTKGNELRFIDTAGEETALLSSKFKVLNALADPEAEVNSGELESAKACVDINTEKLLIQHKEKPIEILTDADAITLTSADAITMTADKACNIGSETDAVTIEASTSITLKVGGNEIVIDASGITITGSPAVNIN